MLSGPCNISRGVLSLWAVRSERCALTSLAFQLCVEACGSSDARCMSSAAWRRTTLAIQCLFALRLGRYSTASGGSASPRGAVLQVVESQTDQAARDTAVDTLKTWQRSCIYRMSAAFHRLFRFPFVDGGEYSPRK